MSVWGWAPTPLQLPWEDLLLILLGEFFYSLGALLKAAFCCAEVVTFPSSQELKDQLNEKYEGGFELMTWSDLPTGSGK